MRNRRLLRSGSASVNCERVVTARCRAGELAKDRSPMLQLKLFGVPTLERDGVQLAGRASQRHRLALLALLALDRKSTRLNSSHSQISYAVFCLKKKKNKSPYALT